MIIGIDASRANAIEKTGTEWYSWYLIRALVPLAAEHTIRLYTREPLRNGLEHLGPNVEEKVLTWRPGLLWSHLRLSWELLFHAPDILLIPADTVPLIHPPQTLTTIHDVAFERFPELYRNKSVQRQLKGLRPLIHFLVRIFTLGKYSASELDYHRWSVRHAVRTSPLLLTVSEFSKNEIHETLKVAKERIIVTPLGVRQPESFQKSKLHDPELLKLHHITRPYFLFIGRLETKKNIDVLIKSYLNYRQQATEPLDLVLIGAPGQGWEEVAAQIPFETKPHIHQLGWVEDRWPVLAQATAFIFVTAYEGFGLPPLEAMSLDVPVIASSAGALPETLGSAAFFVDPKNLPTLVEAMQLVTAHPDLRQKLIAQGREQVKKFTWDQTAKLTWVAMQQLVPKLAKK